VEKLRDIQLLGGVNLNDVKRILATKLQNYTSYTKFQRRNVINSIRTVEVALILLLLKTDKQYLNRNQL